MTAVNGRHDRATAHDEQDMASLRTPAHVILAEASIAGAVAVMLLVVVALLGSRTLLIVTAAVVCGAGAVLVGSRWWRGCSLLPADAERPGLRIRGLVRSHDVPWERVVAVSWTEYESGQFLRSRYWGGRHFTWAKTWVTFIDEADCAQALPVLVTRFDRQAGAASELVWGAAPEPVRDRIGLHHGPPVIPIPAVVVPGKPLTIKGWMLDSRVDRVEGTIITRPGSLEFTVFGPAQARRWDDVVAVHVDLGTSKSSQPEVVVTVRTAAGDKPVFLIDRVDAEAALMWAASAG